MRHGHKAFMARSQSFPPSAILYVVKMQGMDGNRELNRSITWSEVRQAISEYFANRSSP